MNARRLLAGCSALFLTTACSDGPGLTLPADSRVPSASRQGGLGFGSGNRSDETNTAEVTGLAPENGQSLRTQETCYEERGGGAMGSGGRVEVPCPPLPN